MINFWFLNQLHFLFLILIDYLNFPKIVRAAAGIEPATSRTRNENHTTRPSSHADKSGTNKFNLSTSPQIFMTLKQI